jgi:hypothetical protein
MMVAQMELRSGTTRLTAWLDNSVRVGQFVVFKNDDGRWWEVLDKYSTQELSSINRGWNNNI